MKENIYIKVLEIGFENVTNGITFNEVVKELGIEESLKNTTFESNYTSWFYTNFSHKDAEKLVLSDIHGAVGDTHFIAGIADRESLSKFNTQKSFIKGESIQKYINYLELKESRESSQTAKKISYISIGIAIISIFLSPFISRIIPEEPKQVIVTENRDKANDAEIIERLTRIDSTINSTINKISLIAEKKAEVPIKKQTKIKSEKH